MQAPSCRRRLRLLPRAPRAAQRRPPRPCPRRASSSPSPAGARSLAPAPGSAPSSLRSRVESEPFKFSALGCLERGLLATKKDGGEREEETLAAAAGPGLLAPPTPFPPSSAGTQAGGSGERTFGARPVLGSCVLLQTRWFVFASGELLLFSARGRGGLECRAVRFLWLTLDSVRRGLVVVINTTERFPAPRSGSVSESARGPGPRRQPIVRLGQTC